MSYRIRNWSAYNAGLKQRGSLTFWLDEAVLSTWLVKTPSGARGATQTYSDLAIATFETLKAVYRQAGRQTEGLLKSLFELMNVALPVPNHTTVSRRKGSLTVGLPVVPKSGAVHLVVDSTGIKVYGEGEWKRCEPASLCGARERAPRQDSSAWREQTPHLAEEAALGN